MGKQSFSKGDEVQLGDGRKGTIVGKKERAGFHGFIVKITDSVDPNQIGQTVAATAPTMKHIAQMPASPLQPAGTQSIETTEVGTTPESKEEAARQEMLKKELDFKQKQLQFIQDEISTLQQHVNAMVAQTTTKPGGDPMEQLERMEEEEQESLQQQQDISLAQQEMQQERMLQDEKLRQEQQSRMQTPQVTASWVRSERANVKVAIKNTELICDVAATPRQQASGLQAYDHLPENKGLWFPFTAKKSTSFYMGEVKFPIDIIFIDDNKVNKIVANVQPRQMGSWKSICTDVIEVNGGWCNRHHISIGDTISTPLTGKKRASYSEIENLVNTSWSAPQKARITSDSTYDRLRTIDYVGEGEELTDFEREMISVFPFLKSAQEHRQPDTTDRRSPGEYDGRNPNIRYRHNTTPDVSDPFGDGDPLHVDPFSGTTNAPDGTDDGQSNYGKHFHLQRGYDPVVFRESDYPVAIRPAAQKVLIDSPSPDNELAGVDVIKLANGSLTLFDRYGPEWNSYDDDPERTYDSDPGYDKIAIVNDELISQWIDTLGFDDEYEAKLRKTMFTDAYKDMLGEALTVSNRAIDYELFDSDLLLYQ